MKKSIYIAVGIIAVVIIGLVIAQNNGDQPEGENQQTENQGPSLMSMTDGDNTIIMSDQEPGIEVTVHLANLVNSGYVVIHADNEGAPGEVIGVSDLVIGDNENLEVELDRASQPGETLHAMLHTDDGDGVFEFPDADGPLKNAEDKILSVKFRIEGESDGEAMMEDDAMMDDGSEETTEGNEMTIGSEENVVVYTDDGFSPQQITVSAGQQVTFRNESGRAFWPASANHPTHTVYPGSDIAKCDTDEQSQIFDACTPVQAGAEYSFTFNEKGEWNYHDHLRASQTGTVVVE